MSSEIVEVFRQAVAEYDRVMGPLVDDSTVRRERCESRLALAEAESICKFVLADDRELVKASDDPVTRQGLARCLVLWGTLKNRGGDQPLCAEQPDNEELAELVSETANQSR